MLRGVAFQLLVGLLQYIILTTTCHSYPLYEKVCGTDSLTYNNKEDLRLAQTQNPDLLLLHHGPCSVTEQRLLPESTESENEKYYTLPQADVILALLVNSPKRLRDKDANFVKLINDNENRHEVRTNDRLGRSGSRWKQQNPYQSSYSNPRHHFVAQQPPLSYQQNRDINKMLAESSLAISKLLPKNLFNYHEKYHPESYYQFIKTTTSSSLNSDNYPPDDSHQIHGFNDYEITSSADNDVNQDGNEIETTQEIPNKGTGLGVDNLIFDVTTEPYFTTNPGENINEPEPEPEIVNTDPTVASQEPDSTNTTLEGGIIGSDYDENSIFDVTTDRHSENFSFDVTTEPYIQSYPEYFPSNIAESTDTPDDQSAPEINQIGNDNHLDNDPGNDVNNVDSNQDLIDNHLDNDPGNDVNNVDSSQDLIEGSKGQKCNITCDCKIPLSDKHLNVTGKLHHNCDRNIASEGGGSINGILSGNVSGNYGNPEYTANFILDFEGQLHTGGSIEGKSIRSNTHMPNIDRKFEHYLQSPNYLITDLYKSIDDDLIYTAISSDEDPISRTKKQKRWDN